MLGVSNSHLLSSEGIRDHWREVSETLTRLLFWMDSRETWVIEPEAEVLSLLQSVVTEVQAPGFAKEIESGEGAAGFAELLSQLCSSRFVRILEMMDRRQPGIASRLTLALGQLGGESERYVALFYERLLMIHKCELLGQILSKGRSEAIAAHILLIRETQ